LREKTNLVVVVVILLANTDHLQLPLAMFILCPNGGGPPVDGSQQKRGRSRLLGAIDVRAEVKLQQLSATLAARNVDLHSKSQDKDADQVAVGAVEQEESTKYPISIPLSSHTTHTPTSPIDLSSKGTTLQTSITTSSS
jgi:hypothetical protein